MTPSDELQALASRYRAPGIRWRTYPNPMRADGVFVAQDIPILPYSPHGTPRYPAVPATVHAIPFQLPPEDAAVLIELLHTPWKNPISNARSSPTA